MENVNENEINIGDEVLPDFLMNIDWDEEWQEWYVPETQPGILVDIERNGGEVTYVTRLKDGSLVRSAWVKKVVRPAADARDKNNRLLNSLNNPTMKKEAIKQSDDNSPTRYYAAGKIATLPGIGDFPQLLHRMWDEEDEIQNKFKLAAVTADHIYYSDENGDYTESIVMLNREMQLVSDNFFASNDLLGLLQINDGLLWISKAVKYWQREQFVKPGLMTPEIKKQLDQIDVEKLTNNEKAIYFAYLNNGPVKYTKPEALMAVLSNELDRSSDQLVAVLKALQQAEEQPQLKTLHRFRQSKKTGHTKRRGSV